MPAPSPLRRTVTVVPVMTALVLVGVGVSPVHAETGDPVVTSEVVELEDVSADEEVDASARSPLTDDGSGQLPPTPDSPPEESLPSSDEASAEDVEPAEPEQESADAQALEPDQEPGATETPAVPADEADAEAATETEPEPEADEAKAADDAKTADVADGEVRTEDGYHLSGLTEPIDADRSDVLVLGVTWASGDVASVEVREQRAGEWGPWTSLDVDAEAPEEGRPGSDPHTVVDATDVQVRLLTTDGERPGDVQVDVFRTDVTDGDLQVSAQADIEADSQDATVETAGLLATVPPGGGTPGAAGVGAAVRTDLYPSAAVLGTLTAPRPAINSRSSWGAKPYIGQWATTQVRGVVVHHTAGSNSYSRDAVPGILRGIQDYHVKARGWSDIGYNILVDRYGRVWEGRAGGVTNATQGVHTAGYNSSTFGISVIGNFQSAAIPSAAVSAVTRTIAWKLAHHGVRADSTMTVGGKVHPVVIGHRDATPTACPGARFHPLMGSIARNARAMQSINPRTAVNHDLNGSGVADLVAVHGGAAWLYPATTAPVANAQRIGRGWQNMDVVLGSPATDGGPLTDIIARDRRTGELFVYKGNGAGAFRGKVKVGRGWDTIAEIITPGDWTGDGIPDLMGVHKTTGHLLLFTGRGNGRFDNARRVGTGWSGMTSVAGIGDFNGDGLPDLAAIDRRSGQLRLYPNNGRRGVANGKVLLSGWSRFDGLVRTGDFSRDGKADFVARDNSSGQMVTVRGTGTGGVLGVNRWGSGWTGLPHVVAGLTWSGSGGPDIIAVNGKGDMLRYRRNADVSSPRRLFSVASGTQVAVVGDVTANGSADVVSRTSGGVVTLHVMSSTGKVSSSKRLATGWGGSRIAGAADYTGDGVPDLLVVNSSGRLRVHPMTRSGTLRSSFEVGSGFGTWRVTGTGGWTRSSEADVVGLDTATGRLVLFAGTRTGGLRTVRTLGTVPGGAKSVVSPGDVTGDGNPDLIVTDNANRTWIYPGQGTKLGPRMSLSGTIPRTAPLS